MKRPHNMPASAPDPAPVQIPSAFWRNGPLSNETSWEVPVDIMLALPTGSVMKGLIQKRRERGEWPLPLGRVYVFRDRYYAEVYFSGAGKAPSLFYALDVWPLVIKPAAEARP